MIGDLLRAEREKQNLSVKDIEKATSIRALYIDAIEKGDYKTLPGEVYAKGFVRNYANYLKLDANAVVNGKTEFEGTAEKGKTLTVKGKDKVRITAGNAGALKLSLNGKDMGTIGQRGEVVEKTFTKDAATTVR